MIKKKIKSFLDLGAVFFLISFYRSFAYSRFYRISFNTLSDVKRTVSPQGAYAFTYKYRVDFLVFFFFKGGQAYVESKPERVMSYVTKGAAALDEKKVIEGGTDSNSKSLKKEVADEELPYFDLQQPVYTLISADSGAWYSFLEFFFFAFSENYSSEFYFSIMTKGSSLLKNYNKVLLHYSSLELLK